MLKLFLNKGDVFCSLRILKIYSRLSLNTYKMSSSPPLLTTSMTSQLIIIVAVLAASYRTYAELIECKFTEDRCIFDHDIDYNHVYDFRPQPNTTVNNITKISFLRPVPLDVDEIMHRLCDIFYNLHEVYVNGTEMHCDVYHDDAPKSTEVMVVEEDVAGLHHDLLEEVVRKGTARGSDELHQKLNYVVAAVGMLIFVFLFGGIVLLIRYIRKRRQDRFWRRSRLYSSRYGHNI